MDGMEKFESDLIKPARTICALISFLMFIKTSCFFVMKTAKRVSISENLLRCVVKYSVFLKSAGKAAVDAFFISEGYRLSGTA